MTTSTTALPGRPPVVDLATWQAGRPRRYHHMWHDGVPHQGQCAGCTFNVWQMKDTVYLKARGVAFAVLTSGQWEEVAPFVAFMGYAQPWYSVRGVEAPIATDEGHIVCYLRDGDRAFLTYRTTGRGNEPADGSVGLLDMTPYGRGEAWEDNPEGWPEGHHSCWYWATDPDGNATWGPTSRPAAVDPPGRDPRAGSRPARIGAGLPVVLTIAHSSRSAGRWHVAEPPSADGSRRVAASVTRPGRYRVSGLVLWRCVRAACPD